MTAGSRDDARAAFRAFAQALNADPINVNVQEARLRQLVGLIEEYIL